MKYFSVFSLFEICFYIVSSTHSSFFIPPYLEICPFILDIFRFFFVCMFVWLFIYLCFFRVKLLYVSESYG